MRDETHSILSVADDGSRMSPRSPGRDGKIMPVQDAASGIARRLGRRARRLLSRTAHAVLGLPTLDELGTRLVLRKANEDQRLRPILDRYTLEEARNHFADILLEERYLQEVTRYFHARRVHLIAERLGVDLPAVACLDVGDTDGLLLKHLGKNGTALNNSEKACAQIRANGIDVRLGDGQRLPFEDKSFDVALCFETLEHVPNPGLLLQELLRVARKKVFVSIPGVRETLIHPKVGHSRMGEYHIIEFSEFDFRTFLSHFPVRISFYQRIDVFGLPRGLRERLSHLAYASRHLFGGCFRFFQFYELEPWTSDQGVDQAAYLAPYFSRR